MPDPYQRRAVKFLVERAGAALLLDPGLGKTSISLAALKVLKKAGMFRGALVVAPRRVVVSVWPQEQQEWLEFHDLKMVVLHGPGKELRAQERADVYVINYEGLKWLVNSGALALMFKKKWLDILIIDELSKVKHPDSARHKFLASVAHKFARRWGLTGSPASNGLLDLFGQIYMLDLGKALGNKFTHFRFAFFYPSNVNSDFPVWLPKDGATEIIYKTLEPVALRIEASKNVKMPAMAPPIPMRFELDDKARKIYDAMESQFFSVLDDQKDKRKALITASTSAAMLTKCRQIATGAVYEDLVDPLTGEPARGPRKWHVVHDEKLEALQDLVDELQGQQLLVGFEYGHDRARILKLLGEDTPVIAGGVSDKRALAIEAAWNLNQFPVLVAHPQSVGHGLNFQKGGAHHIFFYTLSYDYELWDQFRRRLMRRGNPAARLFVHFPQAKDTVEEAVWASLRTKQRNQNSLLEALEDYRERRKGVYSGPVARKIQV